MIYRFKPSFKTCTRLAALILCLVASAALPNGSPASGKVAPGAIRDGFTISQSSNFAGTVTTEITANAVRMRVGRLGLTIIAKGPTWIGYLYNENNKNYVEVPKNEWKTRFSLGRSSLMRTKDGKAMLTSEKTGKSMSIAGYKANEVEVIRAARPKDGSPAETVTEVWIAADIIPPPEVSLLFCQHLNVPVQKGIPLRVFNKTRGKMVSVLDTLSIKRGAIPPQAFEPMKGYKKVKDEMQLIMEDATDDIIGGSLDNYAKPSPGPAKPKAGP